MGLKKGHLSIKCFNFLCFRHVMLPKEIAKLVPKTHLMSESEWRSIGVQQSQGWIHYMKHDPGKTTSKSYNLIIG